MGQPLKILLNTTSPQILPNMAAHRILPNTTATQCHSQHISPSESSQQRGPQNTSQHHNFSESFSTQQSFKTLPKQVVPQNPSHHSSSSETTLCSSPSLPSLRAAIQDPQHSHLSKSLSKWQHLRSFPML